MIFGRKAVATVAFSMKPASGSWGGSSAFVAQLAEFLRRRDYRIRFDLKQPVDAIMLIDPRVDGRLKMFGPNEIAEYRQRHPRTAVVHRVNECDQRKGTTDIDPMLAAANTTATHTVFIAEWLREYHAERWFDRQRAHCVIYNGADARIFHPMGRPRRSEKLRVVTHHWSDNPLKGFDVYEQVDRALAEGKLPGWELWVIGRWPKELEWQAARTFAPMSGLKLAEHLRQCDLYLTGTRWEPCGMHHVEGAQCGLPLVYHEDGGGVVEAGLKYGIGFREDPVAALLEAKARLEELEARVLAEMPSGDRMCLEFAGLIQRLVAEARER